MDDEKQIIASLSYEDIQEQAAFIEMVARQLTRNLMTQLSQLCNRKSYFTHGGILSEMFEWSLEFFDLYHDEFKSFSEATDVEEAVIAFGYGKFHSLFTERGHLDAYFIDRYKKELLPIICNRAFPENSNLYP